MGGLLLVHVVENELIFEEGDELSDGASEDFLDPLETAALLLVEVRVVDDDLLVILDEGYLVLRDEAGLGAADKSDLEFLALDVVALVGYQVGFLLLVHLVVELDEELDVRRVELVPLDLLDILVEDGGLVVEGLQEALVACVEIEEFELVSLSVEDVLGVDDDVRDSFLEEAEDVEPVVGSAGEEVVFGVALRLFFVGERRG